jgi:hypothetical protein
MLGVSYESHLLREAATLPKLEVSYAEVGLAVEKSAFKPAVETIEKSARVGDRASSSVSGLRFQVDRKGRDWLASG